MFPTKAQAPGLFQGARVIRNFIIGWLKKCHVLRAEAVKLSPSQHAQNAPILAEK